MLSTDNQRQCSRCEEYIHPQSTSCPYCNNDLTGTEASPVATASTSNPLIINPPQPFTPSAASKNPYTIPANPYASPYTPAANTISHEHAFAPINVPGRNHSLQSISAEAPFLDTPPSPHKTSEALHEARVEPSSNSLFKILIPLSLLLSGAVFSLFGSILALYSENGVFTLHWKSSYWPLYLGLSLPFLFFGWRSLNKLDDLD